jgi:hypothetical protein
LLIVFFIPFHESFFQKKKEKKKAQLSVSKSGNRRAISPEGWRSHYALGCCCGHNLCGSFFSFFEKSGGKEITQSFKPILRGMRKGIGKRLTENKKDP